MAVYKPKNPYAPFTLVLSYEMIDARGWDLFIGKSCEGHILYRAIEDEEIPAGFSYYFTDDKSSSSEAFPTFDEAFESFKSERFRLKMEGLK